MGGAGQPILGDLVGPVVAHNMLSLGVMVVVVALLVCSCDDCPDCLKKNRGVVLEGAEMGL